LPRNQRLTFEGGDEMRRTAFPGVVATVGLIVWTGLALGQQMAQFSDDFSSYAPGSDASPAWEPVVGTWQVQDGAYLQTNFRKSGAYSFLREPVVSDFTLSARFYVYPDGFGVKAAGLVFRAQSSADHYFAHFDSKNSQLILYLNQAGGRYTELPRVGGLSLEAEKWHTAKVVCKGPHIAIYLDDQPITEVDDDTFLLGRVGLRAGQGKIAFDDVEVEGAAATLQKEWTVMPESLVQDETDVPRLEAAERVVAVRGGGYFPVLIKLQDGRLGAVIRGGDAHVGIKGRLDWIESSDGGRTWSEPRVIVDSEWDDRNPAMGQMADGTIVMAYAEARSYDAQGNFGIQFGPYVFYYVVSKDGGKTWSEKRPLFNGPLGIGSSPYGKIIVLKDGTALMSQYGDRNPEYAGPVQLPEQAPEIVGVVRSHDNGETWEDFSVLSTAGHNETSLLEMPDGSLIAMMRTDSGAVDQAVSTDGGRTWSEPVRITRDGQHPADIIRLQSGALLMV
jgi:hypothetical protein